MEILFRYPAELGGAIAFIASLIFGAIFGC